jgi:hypothetical protein
LKELLQAIAPERLLRATHAESARRSNGWKMPPSSVMLAGDEMALQFDR